MRLLKKQQPDVSKTKRVIRREQQSVRTKIVNFHSHLASLHVLPFVPLFQSHGVPSPSPACVEAFSLSHPPLIRRLAERRHVDLL